jgi:serine/threonine protein kinase/dihydrodipicolinate synthase/N-acetylneuraminate lyase
MCPACLLRAAMGSDSTLLPAPGESGAAQSPPAFSEQPGTRIGHYKLLEQIGEGGFGIVWMAEQEEPVRRRVALKIIKLGMDTREVVARFEAERQALSMMEHPNIACVFDGGATATGRPYFVMELVKGVPITNYCDVNRLTTKERLELFMEVCHAVQHAHQKGVIHRDLKPSNILVTVKDDRAVPKVIDFGIAKATQATLTARTLFTGLNQRIGTPDYMSPEQAGLGSLDVDTRSDIYSLGVLLYELLTGRPPFDPETLLAAGYDAVMRVIREEEPPKPSTRLSTLTEEELAAVAAKRGAEPAKLNRSVRGDLDWIVMKALEKDRTRRYETANGFADDLRRHLDNEVVLARPPSTAYRMKKAWRRNKVWLSAAAVVLAALVLGVGFSTWQAVRATKAEELAKQRLAESEAIAEFLTSTFQSPDPARDGRTITVAEMLDTAAKKLETDLSDQPARRASLQATLGSTYHALGLFREAIPLQEKVRDYIRATAGPEHPDTLKAMGNLANSYADGRRDEALKLREELLPLFRKVLGPESPDALKAMGNLASSYFDAGRRDVALKLQKEVLALSRKVNGPEHRDTLAAMNNLALFYAAAGRRDETLKLRQDVLTLSNKVSGPKHPDTLAAMTNLADSYFDAGRLDDALKLRDEVLALSREVNGPQHPDTLKAISGLASSFSAASRRDEALKLREETLALSRRVNGPEHPDTLGAMRSLANSYSAAGRRDEALKLKEEVLALSQKVLGPDHPDTLMAMNNLANSYSDAGRRDEALTLREEVLTLRRKVLGPEHPDTLLAMTNLAGYYRLAGRLDEALKLREEVLRLSRMMNGPKHPDTLIAMYNLANFYYAGGRLDAATKLSEEVLPLLREVRGQEHPDTLLAMASLALSYHDAGRRNGALKLREEVLPLCRKVLGPEHPNTLRAMANLAVSLGAAGRLIEAIKLQEDVLPLFLKVLGPEHADTLMAMSNLALSYFKDGRIQESARIRSEHAEFLRRAGNGPDGEVQVQLHQLLAQLAEQQCKGPVKEDAIERYYGGNKESFRETSVHLYTITFQLETTEEARAEQRKKVEALRDEIANGKPFAEVAKEHSEDPYASDGGDNMTVNRRDRTEPLDSAIFALKPGVPAIHDDGTFLRILKAEDRAEGEIAPLAEVREDIAGILQQQQRDELLQQWQEKARVKVDAWEKENNHADGASGGATGEKETPKNQGARNSNRREP